MKPADVCIAVLVAVIWGLAFVASRIALNEFSPELRMFDLFAWLCLVASLPLAALTLASNGAQPVWHALTQMSPTGLVCMLLLAARLPRGAGGAVCAIGAVRRFRGIERCV